MSNQWQQTGGRRGGEKAIMWLCILLGVALAAVAVIAVRHWLPKPGADDEKIEKTIVTATPVKAVTILDAEDPTTVLEMEPGERRTLQASLEPADASATIRWSSGDESIATVDSSGTVSCVGTGRVVITAAVGDLTAQVMIEVEEAKETTGGGSEPSPEPQSGTKVDTYLGAHFIVPEGFYQVPFTPAAGYANRYYNDVLQMEIYVSEIGAYMHPYADSAIECIEKDYQLQREGKLSKGDDITFDSQKTHKWVLSGYEDGGQTVFYMCEMAADDDFAIYSVEFNYPAANAKTCDPIVGDFMKNFTYDR